MIDDEHRLVVLIGHELQPELLLDCRERIRPGEIDVRKSAAIDGRIERPPGRPIEIDVERACETCLDDDWPS